MSGCSRTYRDNPSEHPGVNEAELRLLPPHRSGHGARGEISRGKLLRSKSVWALGIQWFSHYYGFYFYITWLPLYLYQARGLDLRYGALASGLPLFSAGLGSLFGGWALSRLTSRVRSTARARRLMGYAAYGGAAALLLLFTMIANPGGALLANELAARPHGAPDHRRLVFRLVAFVAARRTGVAFGFVALAAHLFAGVHGPLLSVFSVKSASRRRFSGVLAGDRGRGRRGGNMYTVEIQRLAG